MLDVIEEKDGLRVRLVVEEDAPDPRDEFGSLNCTAAAVQAWRDGEVYGYVLEELVTWLRIDGLDGVEVVEGRVLLPEGTVVAERVRQDWQEIESVWGFYGRGWAEQNAHDVLAERIAARAEVRA
jgi:hypothetical protein